MQDIPSDAPAPRLCHIVKWPDFEGFGFNMHADKVRGGQFIGKVDPGSPAEAAGLKADDRIIEVNGVNISNENHKQVVQRIKLVPNETKLLVLDSEAYDYYKSRDIIVRGTQSNVQHKQTPERQAENKISSKIPEEVPQTHESKPYVNGRTSDASSMSSEDLNSAPAPRLCHVIKLSDKEGYGFHLMADKNKKGHFIGKVDPGTPAESAGLKKGDRIIEVNGANVVEEAHKDVVQRIKAVAGETKLLVLDPSADSYYKERNITVNGKQSNVIHLKTPVPVPVPVPEVPAKKVEEDAPAELRNRDAHDRRSQISQSSGSTVQVSSSESRSTSPRPASPSSPARPQSAVSVETLAAASASGLNLGMSAAEMRARLASRKKFDPKKESMDLRQKHQIVQTM